jgi:hypothetical protein
LKNKKAKNVIYHQGSRLISQDEFTDWVLISHFDNVIIFNSSTRTHPFVGSNRIAS